MWCHSKKSVFTYAVKNEGRAVWRIYLELGDFEEAKKHCTLDRHLDEGTRFSNIFRTCVKVQFLKRDFSKSRRIEVFWPIVFEFWSGAAQRFESFWFSF